MRFLGCKKSWLASAGVFIFMVASVGLFAIKLVEVSGVASVPFVETPGKRKKTSICEEEIKRINDAAIAFNRGEDQFGGDDVYDLTCAQAAYERAIILDPDGNLLAWHQSGRVDFIQGNFDVALHKFNKQIEYFGETIPNVHYMLGLTYGYKARKTGAVEDWQKAEESFTRYIELDPLSPWARVDLAWVYFAQGKYEEMKPYLEKGMLTNPENPWLLNMYGLALLNTDDREGARIYFKWALHFAELLTVEEWGRAYPGNNPQLWEKGLKKMISSIEKNKILADA